MYNIAIRADGGPAVGMGHIMRCLAIAEELKNLGCRVYFLGRYTQGLNKAKDMGFESFEIIIPLKPQCNTHNMKKSGTHITTATGFNYGSVEEIEDDISATFKIIKQQGCDLILVDKYNLSSEYFNKFREFDVKVAFIDDLNLFRCSADIIINGNINAKMLGYKECFTNQKLLLGTKFTPLRGEFKDIPNRRINYFLNWHTIQNLGQCEMNVCEDNNVTAGLIDFSQNEKNMGESPLPEVMITTGGADPYNCTGRLLEILLRDDKTSCIRYNVIVSSGFVYKNQLHRMADENANIVLYNNPKCMSQIMCRSDLAISSGGSTLYELCCCGTPTIAFIMADNQKGIVDMLSRDGYIKTLGWHTEIENSNIAQQVYDLITHFELRKSYSQKMQSLIDGIGAFRVAQNLVELLSNKVN